MDKISIIVPIYNTDTELLENCIQSAVNQSYNNVEIIMVDDGSYNLNTLNKCEELVFRYNEVSYIRQENKGPSVARGRGIIAAQGEYIMFLDSDDALADDACVFLLDIIKKCGGDIAEGIAIEVENNKTMSVSTTETWVKSCNGTNLLLDKLVDGSDIPLSWSLWGKLYRTSIMKTCYKEYPFLKRGEDVLALAEYLVNSQQLVYSNKCVYYYNIGNLESITRNKKVVLDNSLCIVWKKMIEIYKNHAEEIAYERVKANYCTSLFGTLLQYVCNDSDELGTDIAEMKKEMHSHCREFLFNRYISRRFKCMIAMVYPEIFRYVKKLKMK